MILTVMDGLRLESVTRDGTHQDRDDPGAAGLFAAAFAGSFHPRGNIERRAFEPAVHASPPLSPLVGPVSDLDQDERGVP
jgi:hypothetical protein